MRNLVIIAALLLAFSSELSQEEIPVFSPEKTINAFQKGEFELERVIPDAGEISRQRICGDYFVYSYNPEVGPVVHIFYRFDLEGRKASANIHRSVWNYRLVLDEEVSSPVIKWVFSDRGADYSEIVVRLNKHDYRLAMPCFLEKDGQVG